jgi:hypothetical protein
MNTVAANPAAEFAGRIKALGFRVFIAAKGPYGFITDADGSRVLCFSLDSVGSLSGTYSPPSTTSGTGWRMDRMPGELRTAADVKAALYATAPPWAGNGWKRYTTLPEHLAAYGSSSGYSEV